MGLFITTNQISKLNKTRETEKAIGIKAWASNRYGKKTWEIIVWIPKSIIVNNIIPDWFLNKKHSDYNCDNLDVVMEMA